MPKKFDSIVKRLKEKGHSENSAYALANYITDKQEKRKRRRKRRRKK